jgi:hypothetical protein
MSRWAETFAALSGGSDTLDTMRHCEVSRSIVSQSVHSVTAAPAATATTAGVPFMITQAMKAELGLRGFTPDQIRDLTPAEAHAIRSTVPAPSAAPPPPPAPADTAPATGGEAEAERAAIVEHDGSIPHTWAEGFARLDPDRPPGDVPLRRWQRFVDDAGRFLDSPFCAVAAALGWTPCDLFGCDRNRPFARIDQAGLLWLLNGDRLVMLAEDAATIETRTGARQTWRRKPSEPGRVLVWDLVL